MRPELRSAAKKAAQTKLKLEILYDECDSIVSDRLAESDREPSCKAGCAYCCHHLVPATMPEVIGALLEAFNKGHRKLVSRWAKIKRDHNNAVETLKQHGPDSEAVWARKRRPCLFLTKQNRCAAYAKRPAVCRGFVSFDDPKRCRDLKGIKVSDAAVTVMQRAGEELGDPVPMQVLLPKAIQLIASGATLTE